MILPADDFVMEVIGPLNPRKGRSVKPWLLLSAAAFVELAAWNFPPMYTLDSSQYNVETWPESPGIGVTVEVLGLNSAIPWDSTPPKLVKLPATTTFDTLPSLETIAHMDWMLASEDAIDANPPSGKRARTDSAPFEEDATSLCPSYLYNEMPSKSPAIPTRPNCERSRFGDGMGLNVTA